jgi:hypothetical protein
MESVYEVIKKYKGRRGLVAKKLGVTLSQLSAICEEVPELQEEFEAQTSLKEQLVQDIFDIQLETSLILKEPWALAYMSAKNAGINIEDAIPVPVNIEIPVEDGRVKNDV